MIYFSAKTNGFYLTDVVEKEWYETKGGWPDDATEISIADYEKYLSTPPDGMALGSTKKGMPTWVPTPEPDEDTAVRLFVIKKQQLMTDAENAIVPLSRAIKLDMATDEEKGKLEAWERYSVLLSRVGHGDEWPEIPQ